ncbi:MAG: tetratricopeptide repeat protein [Armatimonadota bacterium]|nr:tetratricopeptide repeat protein [Armatimonadota bacterium]
MGVIRTGEEQPEACSGCGQPVRREFNFCPSCGVALRAVCPTCHGVMEPGWKFCVVCGTNPEAEVAMRRHLQAALAGRPAVAVSGDDLPEVSEIDERAEAHNTRGTELYENDAYEEAVREFSAAVSLNPTNPTYHVNLAVALSEQGDFDRAIAEFQEALRLDPENVAAYLQMGYTFQEMEQPRRAVEAWKKVIELAPGSAEAEEAEEALDSI